MEATALLERQHRHVEAVFKKLLSGHDKPRALLEDLADSLAAHMAIEQEIFYPAIHEIDEDAVRESFEEHALAEIALKRLLATDPDDPSFKARVKATQELIEHHVSEEEEELFPEVEKKLDEDRLSELGKQMKARFDEVMADGHDSVLPKGYAKTSADVARPKALAA
jgi:hemerythrin superfamily protein